MSAFLQDELISIKKRERFGPFATLNVKAQMSVEQHFGQLTLCESSLDQQLDKRILRDELNEDSFSPEHGWFINLLEMSVRDSPRAA